MICMLGYWEPALLGRVAFWFVVLLCASFAVAVAAWRDRSGVRRAWIPFSLALGGFLGLEHAAYWSVNCPSAFESIFDRIEALTALVGLVALGAGVYTFGVHRVARRWPRLPWPAGLVASAGAVIAAYAGLFFVLESFGL